MTDYLRENEQPIMLMQEIPTDQLMKDLIEGIEDLAWCRKAILAGITTYKPKDPRDTELRDVVKRAQNNMQVNKMIKAELTLRGINVIDLESLRSHPYEQPTKEEGSGGGQAEQARAIPRMGRGV